MKNIIFLLIAFLLLGMKTYSQASVLAAAVTSTSGMSFELMEKDSAHSVASAFFSNIHAEKKNDAVKLVWVIESVNKSSYYVIERSRDGKNFQPIGSLKVKNSQSCLKAKFVDSKPLSGISYYRVKQVNFKSKHPCSEVISLIY